MGCDIHAFIEYRSDSQEKRYDESWWSFGGEFHLDRDYEAFGNLAGVRQDDRPHISPRGLPTDLGYATRHHTVYMIDGSGTRPSAVYHDPGLRRTSGRRQSSGKWIHPNYLAFLAAMRALEKAGQEVRAVFWFDN